MAYDWEKTGKKVGELFGLLVASGFLTWLADYFTSLSAIESYAAFGILAMCLKTIIDYRKHSK